MCMSTLLILLLLTLSKFESKQVIVFDIKIEKEREKYRKMMKRKDKIPRTEWQYERGR